MIVEIVYLQVYWVNLFIPRDYISTTLSPDAIITGRTYDYNMVCGPGSQFGVYVRTHESTDNNMAPRTVSAITLRPTANTQGSFYYYSLTTGRRLIRRTYTSIHMPDEVIARVHFIATRQKNPDGFTFTRMDGTPMPIEYGDDDSTVEANVVKPVYEIINEVADEIVDEIDNNEPPAIDNDCIDAVENHDDLPLEEEIANENAEPDGEAGVADPDPIMENDNGADDAAPDINNELPNLAVGDNNDKKTVSWTDVSEDNVITNGGCRRQPRKCNATDGYQFTNIGEDMDKFLMEQTAYVVAMQTVAQVDTAVVCAINHIILTQLGMKKGIKTFGEAGVRSMYKGMKQFHDRELVKPLSPH